MSEPARIAPVMMAGVPSEAGRWAILHREDLCLSQERASLITSLPVHLPASLADGADPEFHRLRSAAPVADLPLSVSIYDRHEPWLSSSSETPSGGSPIPIPAEPPPPSPAGSGSRYGPFLASSSSSLSLSSGASAFSTGPRPTRARTSFT